MSDSSSTAANWTRAVSSMKAALADLELAGNTIVGQLAAVTRQCAEAVAAADRRIADAATTADRRIADAVATADRRIEDVSVRSDAAVERARQDAQSRIDELHRSIERLRADLEAERELRQQMAAPVVQSIAAPADTAAPETDAPVDAPAPTEMPTPGFDGAGYASQLLDHLESVYLADEAAGIPPSELVDRLVANLLYASEVFVRRGGEGNAFQAFERQLTAALDAKGGTSFGRRLAVAAFELSQRRKNGRAHVA